MALKILPEELAQDRKSIERFRGEVGDRNLNPRGATRRALRQARSKPLLEDIRANLEREQPQVVPKSPGGASYRQQVVNLERAAALL